jgi:hypothetical protein
MRDDVRPSWPYALAMLCAAGACLAVLAGVAFCAPDPEKSPLLGSSIAMSGKAGFRFEYDCTVLPGGVVVRRARCVRAPAGGRIEFRSEGHCGVVGDVPFEGQTVRDRYPGRRLVERQVKMCLYVRGRFVGSGLVTVYAPEGER